MLLSRTLLYFATIIGLSWAGIPYEDIKPKIFDSKSTDYENDLYETMMKENDDATQVLLLTAGAAVVSFVPVVGKAAASLILPIYHFFEDGSAWKRTFTRTIVDGSDRKALEDHIIQLQGRLDAIQNSLLTSKNLDLNTVTWSTRKDLDFMMNIFAAHKSLFKKYPLVAAPVVIQLALFIASLDSNINNHEISCTMRNILLEYRKRTVDARFDKITSHGPRKYYDKLFDYTTLYDVGLVRSHVMSYDYNRNGYYFTNELACEKYTKLDKSPLSPTYAMFDEFDEEFCYGIYESKPQEKEKHHPLIEFNQIDADYNSLSAKSKCAIDYFSMIRHRVERLFPVELFNGYCGSDDSQISTGRGYLTIRFKHGSFVVEHDGGEPEIKGDDPYIDVYIDGELKWRSSPPLKSCFQCDFDATFESDKLNKNSKIKIEVWDKDKGRDNLFDADDLIIDGADVEGTVDDFLKKGMFLLKNHQHPYSKFYNYIETVSFWKDEYNLKPIDSEFRKKNQESDGGIDIRL